MKNKLVKFILEQLNDNTIFHLNIPLLISEYGNDIITDSRNKLSCYIIENKSELKTSLKKMNLYGEEYPNLIHVKEAGKHVILLLDKQGFSSIPLVLESNTDLNPKDPEILYLRLNRLVGNTSTELHEISEIYPVTVKNQTVTVECNISSYVAVYGSDILQTEIGVISKLVFSLNEDNTIRAISIDIPHPNAELSTNSYCLGSLKFKTLNLNTLNEVIQRLSVINLNDCYWIPTNLISFVEECRRNEIETL